MTDDRIRTVETDVSRDESERTALRQRRLILALTSFGFLAAIGLLLSFSERNESAAGRTSVTMPSTTTLPLLAGGTTIASLGTTLVEAGLPICENATRLAVAGFFEATARGDASDADGHFATDDFVEYTELPYRTDDEARRRDTLLEYLQTRVAEGSRLYLVGQQYHGGTGDRLANFGAVAFNETSATISGTGTVNCQSGEIVALYLAAKPPTPGSETEPLLLGSANVDGFADGQCIPTMPTEEFVPPEPYPISGSRWACVAWNERDMDSIEHQRRPQPPQERLVEREFPGWHGRGKPRDSCRVDSPRYRCARHH